MKAAWLRIELETSLFSYMWVFLHFNYFLSRAVSLPGENVATYLAGYLPQKLHVENCSECSNQLILLQLPCPYEGLSMYDFIRSKTYQESVCLTYQTAKVVTFVKN